MKQKAFALCGIFAVALYVAAVIIGGIVTPGYSHIANAVSELIASGAPAKAVLDSLFIGYNLLLVAFAAGFWKGAGGKGQKAARLAAIFIWVAGILGVLMAQPFPMDQRNTPATFAGIMHIAAAGLCFLSTMLAVLFAGISFGKAPEGRSYAFYSYITLAIIFVTGGLAAASAGMGSALMGFAERATIGAFLQ
ncbi:MAG: DUF998 domain-containing protein [Firmicutes bacterium]|nr:DUF998 domain-containing protein [Bacillota bacterium]